MNSRYRYICKLARQEITKKKNQVLRKRHYITCRNTLFQP